MECNSPNHCDITIVSKNYQQHQSGAAEAWWAHNPQVPGSKPGSDKEIASLRCTNVFLYFISGPISPCQFIWALCTFSFRSILCNI